MENEFVDSILDREYSYDWRRNSYISPEINAPTEDLKQAIKQYNEMVDSVSITPMFRVGDTVRLKNGQAPIIIDRFTSQKEIVGHYVKSGKNIVRKITDIVKYKEEIKSEERERHYER